MQLILWTGKDDLAPGSDAFKAYRSVSKAFKGKLVFVTVNKDGDAHEPVTNYFGLKDSKAPVVRCAASLPIAMSGCMALGARPVTWVCGRANSHVLTWVDLRFPQVPCWST